MTRILTATTNVERDSVIWNTLVGVWFTFQPTVISFVITHVLGMTETGQFAYAVAQAYLFWGIGVYGMRRYQASDVRGRFSLGDYVASRVVSTAAMVLAGVGFVVIGSVTSSIDRTTLLLILAVLALRVVDSIEDVYLGHFQQTGRLDIGSKLSMYRSAVSTLVIVVAIPLTHDMFWSVVLGTVVSALLLAAMLPRAFVVPLTVAERAFSMRSTWRLLAACAPLFVATFVSIYVINAPRYAINAQMDAEAQGYFAWLSLAPFLITLLSMIIYNPVVTTMATLWVETDLVAFQRWVRRLTAAIVGVTVLALGAGYLWGVPVLNLVTRQQFESYRAEIVILLFAGGLSAWAGLASTVLTIVRQQTWFTVGTLAAAGVGLTGDLWVRSSGLRGASWLYVAVFLVQGAVLGVVMQVVIRRRREMVRAA